MWTYGRIEIQFQHLKRTPPFDADERRAELAHRLRGIPGAKLQPDVISARPAFDLALLVERASLEKFFDVMQWAVAQIEA